MILMNTIQDQNILNVAFQVEFDYSKLQKQSLGHLTNLIGHEGPGSLFQCLKKLNFASSLETAVSTSHITLFRQVSITLTLTEDGLAQHRVVLAIIDHYLKLVKTEWLQTAPALFRETQIVNKLNFELYKVPD